MTKSECEESLKKANFVRESKIGDVISYMLVSKEERFRSLMILYDRINPAWKSGFRDEHSGKVCDDILTVINRAQGNDLVQAVLSMYAADGISRECRVIMYDILDYFFEETSEESFKNLIEKRNNKRELYDSIGRALDSGNESISEYYKKVKRNMVSKYGIDDYMLYEIDEKYGKELAEVVKVQKSSAYIKDFEMDRTLECLEERGNISYGRTIVVSTDKNGGAIYERDGLTKVRTPLFVVDLPYYGQFSVHMKSAKSISSLSKTNYGEIGVYNKKVMVLDNTPEKVDKYLEEIKRKGVNPTLQNLLPTLKRLSKTNTRFVHYLALRLGATKNELDEIYGINQDKTSEI